jgi:transposase
MFFPEARVRVYLYGRAVDMRRSYDGLYAIARAAFAGDPTCGDLYVFVNRRGSQMKVLRGGPENLNTAMSGDCAL